MAQVRKSKQRDAILENLKNRVDHPTAMELYLDVRNVIPSLSLGTLYRNLSQLCESGAIMKLSVGDAEHFDYNAENHYHLMCRACGRFYDLPVPLLSDLESDIDKQYDGTIEGHSLILYGVCADCTAQHAE